MAFQSMRPVLSSTTLGVSKSALLKKTRITCLRGELVWRKQLHHQPYVKSLNKNGGQPIAKDSSNRRYASSHSLYRKHARSLYFHDLYLLRRSESASTPASDCSTVKYYGQKLVIRSSSNSATSLPWLTKINWHGPCPQTEQLSNIAPIKSRHSRFPILPAENQRRTLFGSASRGNLSLLEESANKFPDDANVQHKFYLALSRANMPAIIIERYQSKKFAANAACENLYHLALGALNSSTTPGNQGRLTSRTSSSHNANHLQAVGQAIAASSQAANIAIPRSAAPGNGYKESPLYVVVEESLGVQIFKWVKFMLVFGFVVYFCLALVTLVIDSLQSIKKVSGKTDNEAKAEQQNVRFTDVHGCDEAKEELQELVEFLKNPEKFSALGGKLPKGVLLVGPPGTGKTLLARAVAGEAGVPFFFMSGSEFDEIYVGVGAKRVRELFTAAKSKSPAIVFIDELDAIGGKRSARDSNYAKQTLNQLLTELDGFDQNSGVIILGATNFPESLDNALTRPGRFDRNVVVDLPDVRGRMAILKHHMKNVVVANDVNIEVLAAGTPGFSGAELENIINQAAIRASKAKSSQISMLDFEWAKDKLMMGAEKRSMLIPQKEKELTAYHEAGHALVLMFTRGANPLHKVTIMPRGQALGITFHLPEMDKYSKTVEEYRATIDVCMGGKVAEELIFGAENVTSGCSSDLTQATKAAYSMVASFGMSEKLGHVDLASNYENLSAGTKQLVESEVRRTLDDGYERAKKLIVSRKKELHLLAKALLEYEVLDREEAFKVIKGERLEGKTIISSGSIKIPEINVSLAPELPPLAETVMQPPAGKGPPRNGAMA